MERRITRARKDVYRYHAGKKTRTYLTHFGCCKKWAEDLIEEQYERRHRCVCGGRRFCDFHNRANLMSCRKSKMARVIRLAKRIARNNKKEMVDYE